MALPTADGFAQEPPLKPGPELQKLNYFLGSWTVEGDVKPSPMGPGRQDHHQPRGQVDGRRFLRRVPLHRQDTSMGNGTAIAFMGYDPQEKVYTYDEFNSMGQTVHSKGTVDGDIWT